MSSEKPPRVTVFIPAYNAESYIAEAIESILAQTWTEFELLVIDDGSTDATTEIVARYTGDSRARLLTNDGNRGQVATRNRGLYEARGEYIAMMDADDISLPERLAKQVDFLDHNSRIDLVGCQIESFDSESGETRGRWLSPCEPARIAIASLYDSPVPHATVMARRDVLCAFGYREGFPAAEDYDLWSRMLVARRFLACLPDRLYLYRRHPTQVSQTYASDTNSSRRAIARRQLQALGVDCNETDLDRHLAIQKGRSFHRQRFNRPMDRDYLVWMRDWLTRIQAGNRHNQLCAQPVLDRHLADLWTFACRKTAREAGLGVGLLYFTCSLSWQGLLGKFLKSHMNYS